MSSAPLLNELQGGAEWASRCARLDQQITDQLERLSHLPAVLYDCCHMLLFSWTLNSAHRTLQ